MARPDSFRVGNTCERPWVNDIVTGASRKAQLGAPVGVPLREMTQEQEKMLTDLIEEYAHRLRKELADEELSKLRAAGLENVYFAWAGGSEPGQPHYYRIQGPTFVVEYDNTQDNANHIHTVWRDFDHDFGLDPLRAHYLLARTIETWRAESLCRLRHSAQNR